MKIDIFVKEDLHAIRNPISFIFTAKAIENTAGDEFPTVGRGADDLENYIRISIKPKVRSEVESTIRTISA